MVVDGNGTQTFQIKKRENISDCANLGYYMLPMFRQPPIDNFSYRKTMHLVLRASQPIRRIHNNL